MQQNQDCDVIRRMSYKIRNFPLKRSFPHSWLQRNEDLEEPILSSYLIYFPLPFLWKSWMFPPPQCAETSARCYRYINFVPQKKYLAGEERKRTQRFQRRKCISEGVCKRWGWGRCWVYSVLHIVSLCLILSRPYQVLFKPVFRGGILTLLKSNCGSLKRNKDWLIDTNNLFFYIFFSFF